MPDAVQRMREQGIWLMRQGGSVCIGARALKMATDTSEKGLETLIVQHMTDTDGLPPVAPVSTGTGPTTNVAARPNTALGERGFRSGTI